MNLEELKAKLKKYKKEDLVFTPHAKLQAEVRQTDVDEIKENIINPEKLVYFEEQPSKKTGEKKYDCYFAYSQDFYHRYIIVLNRKILIVTVIGVNRRWQHLLEKGK